MPQSGHAQWEPQVPGTSHPSALSFKGKFSNWSEGVQFRAVPFRDEAKRQKA